MYMRSRTFLIHPPTGLYRREDRCQSRVEDPTVRIALPPIQLAYMAAVLEAQGMECSILDCPAEGIQLDVLLEELAAYRPEVLIAATTAPTLPKDLVVARSAKERIPELKVILFGNHLSLYGERVLAEAPFVDCLITESPEFVVDQLVARGPSQGIPNLMYREGSEVIRTLVRSFLDYDLLPLPARGLLKNGLYRIPDTQKPITVVEAARGCTGRCIFCPVARRADRRVYTRSVSSILAELTECIETHHIDTFLFNADNFTARKAWVMELTEAIVQSDLKIRWMCNSRVDSVDTEMLTSMKKAGCSNIGFGVESGSQALLDKMRKDTTVDQARETFLRCRSVGITSHAFFLIGLPWETRQTLEETYRLARALPADFFDIHIAYPLPNTEFFDICTRDNLFVHSLDAASYTIPAIRSYHLGAYELEKARKRMLLRLFLRPGYILRTLRRARSLKELNSYLRNAAAKLRSMLS